MRCPNCCKAELHVNLVNKTAWCPDCRINWTKMRLMELTPAQRMYLSRPIATSQLPASAESDDPIVVEG